MSDNIPCDDIEVISWESMPRTMRVGDFCNHCEFKYDHGKQLIFQHRKMQKFQSDVNG